MTIGTDPIMPKDDGGDDEEVVQSAAEKVSTHRAQESRKGKKQKGKRNSPPRQELHKAAGSLKLEEVPTADAMQRARDSFLGSEGAYCVRSQHLLDDPERKQLEYCLKNPKASARGQRWAVDRIFQLRIADRAIEARNRLLEHWDKLSYEERVALRSLLVPDWVPSGDPDDLVSPFDDIEEAGAELPPQPKWRIRSVDGKRTYMWEDLVNKALRQVTRVNQDAHQFSGAQRPPEYLAHKAEKSARDKALREKMEGRKGQTPSRGRRS